MIERLLLVCGKAMYDRPRALGLFTTTVCRRRSYRWGEFPTHGLVQQWLLSCTDLPMPSDPIRGSPRLFGLTGHLICFWPMPDDEYEVVFQ